MGYNAGVEQENRLEAEWGSAMKKQRSELTMRVLVAVVTALITAGLPLVWQALRPAQPLRVVLQDLRTQEPEAFDQYIEETLSDRAQTVLDHSEAGLRMNGVTMDCYTSGSETYVSLSDLLRAGGGALTLDAGGALALTGIPAPETDTAFPQGQAWLEACPPYELGDFALVLASRGESMQIGGSSHTDGLLSATAWSSQALFALQGKYRTLTVTAGHVDGTDMVDCTYNFYVDDALVKTVTLEADALPTAIEIPLNYGGQLKIENLDTVSRAQFGFVDGYFIP